jgi:hypothetical protein
MKTLHEIITQLTLLCAFNGPVSQVSKTQIITGRIKVDSAYCQFVSYGNKIVLDRNVGRTARVIPVPCKAGDLYIMDSKELWSEVLLADMQKAFDDLKPKPKSLGFGAHSSYSFGSSSNSQPLQVYNIGSYVCSVAESIHEFDRIDPAYFKLSPGLKDHFMKCYGQDPYCYLIMQLTESGDYHPITYLHPIPTGDQLKGLVQDHLMIPTRHYHPKQISTSHGKYSVDPYIHQTSPNPYMNNYNDTFHPIFNPNYNNAFSISNFNINTTDYADDWDHDIYVFNPSKFDTDILLFKDRTGKYEPIPFTSYGIDDPTKRERYNYPTDNNAKQISSKWIHKICSSFSNCKWKTLTDQAKEVAEKKATYSMETHNVIRLEVKGTYPNGDFLINVEDKRSNNEGINCDDCGSVSFRGTRWACLTCNVDPFYDLCDSCHKNHKNFGFHSNQKCVLAEVNTSEQATEVNKIRFITKKADEYYKIANNNAA